MIIFHPGVQGRVNRKLAIWNRRDLAKSLIAGAGAALLANLSIERQAIMRWDPEAMNLL